MREREQCQSSQSCFASSSKQRHLSWSVLYASVLCCTLSKTQFTSCPSHISHMLLLLNRSSFIFVRWITRTHCGISECQGNNCIIVWSFTFLRRRVWSLVFWGVAPSSHVEVDWHFRGVYVPLKRRSTSTWLHGATSQKTLNFNCIIRYDCTSWKLYLSVKIFGVGTVPLQICLEQGPNVIKWLTLVIHIREVPGSKLGLETGYPVWNISWFLSLPPDKWRNST
jgi:hypothetical protein